MLKYYDFDVTIGITPGQTRALPLVLRSFDHESQVLSNRVWLSAYPLIVTLGRTSRLACMQYEEPHSDQGTQIRVSLPGSTIVTFHMCLDSSKAAQTVSILLGMLFITPS